MVLEKKRERERVRPRDRETEKERERERERERGEREREVWGLNNSTAAMGFNLAFLGKIMKLCLNDQDF